MKILQNKQNITSETKKNKKAVSKSKRKRIIFHILSITLLSLSIALEIAVYSGLINKFTQNDEILKQIKNINEMVLLVTAIISKERCQLYMIILGLYLSFTHRHKIYSIHS